MEEGRVSGILNRPSRVHKGEGSLRENAQLQLLQEGRWKLPLAACLLGARDFPFVILFKLLSKAEIGIVIPFCK